jgi:hypothetical protein
VLPKRHLSPPDHATSAPRQADQTSNPRSSAAAPPWMHLFWRRRIALRPRPPNSRPTGEPRAARESRAHPAIARTGRGMRKRLPVAEDMLPCFLVAPFSLIAQGIMHANYSWMEQHSRCQGILHPNYSWTVQL